MGKSSSEPILTTSPPPPPPPPRFGIFSATSNPTATISKETYAASMGVKLGEPEVPFTPCFMFFYGSLMDAEVLQSVLGLRHTPIVKRGVTEGFAMKMWGIYPTIIPSKEGKIAGTVWKVDLVHHFSRLQEYETGAYTWCSCDVKREDGEMLQGCRTFCWAGDANSKELDEGSFDLGRYQKYFKASVVRK